MSAESLVVEYDPAWREWFQRLRLFFCERLTGWVAIEHVGSTAVRGMVAKPIIDIDIVVPADSLDGMIAQIISVGYEHQGDLGIAGRQAFKIVDHEPRVLPSHHLYAVEEGNLHLRRHRAYRDFMREHPEWRANLNALKLDLICRHPGDRQAYIDGKDAMVCEITALAMMGEQDAAGAVGSG